MLFPSGAKWTGSNRMEDDGTLLASVGEVGLNPTYQKCQFSEGSLNVKLLCRHQRTINLFLFPVFLFPEIHTAMLVAFSPV